jgi:hypothetical protein
MLNIDKIQALFDGSAIETIKLEHLVMDAGTQSRAKLNPLAVEKYTANFEDGMVKEFPPVDVIQLTEPVTLPDSSVLEEGALILVDGFHRVKAATGAKLTEFKARIAKGTLEDAKYYGMQANSTHGTQLGGKDYQSAIRKLYEMDAVWREHGQGKVMAKLFSCSTKTIERALKAIKAEIKAQAFKMFAEGADNETVAHFAVIHEKTAQAWREEWEKTQAKPDEGSSSEESEGEGSSSEGSSSEGDTEEIHMMDLTFGQVLRLKNPDLKAQLLKMLMDSIKADNKPERAPWEPEETPEEQPQDEPEKTPEEPATEPEKPAIEQLHDDWRDKDCWELFGKTKEELEGLKNPKSAIKRAYTKLLKKCHSDHHGDNEALNHLKECLKVISSHF